MDADVGPARTEGEHPKELRRMLVERRRELVEAMVFVGLSVRRMVEELARADPPIIAARSTVGDDVVLIKRRWIERNAKSFEEKSSRIWAVLDAIEAALMPEALGGDLKASREVIRIQDRKARLIGAYKPDQLQLIGAGGGAIQFEHTFSIEAAAAQGLAIAADILGSREPIEAVSHDRTNGNGHHPSTNGDSP